MTWHCFSHADDRQISNSLANENRKVSLLMIRYDSGMFGCVLAAQEAHSRHWTPGTRENRKCVKHDEPPINLCFYM